MKTYFISLQINFINGPGHQAQSRIHTWDMEGEFDLFFGSFGYLFYLHD